MLFWGLLLLYPHWAAFWRMTQPSWAASFQGLGVHSWIRIYQGFCLSSTAKLVIFNGFRWRFEHFKKSGSSLTQSVSLVKQLNLLVLVIFKRENRPKKFESSTTGVRHLAGSPRAEGAVAERELLEDGATETRGFLWKWHLSTTKTAKHMYLYVGRNMEFSRL